MTSHRDALVRARAALEPFSKLDTPPSAFFAARDALALIDTVLAATPAETPTHRHKKRGTEYAVVGNARIQSDTPLADMDWVVVYRSIGHDGTLWARNYDEFNDGRFEALAADAAPEGGR